MKKFVSIIMSFLLVLTLLFIPSQKTYAAGLSLSASSTNVSVGDTVNVTLTVPSGYFAQCTIAVSDASILDGNYDFKVARGDAGGQDATYSFSLKANAVGSCTITAECIDGSDVNGDPIALNSASVTITVENTSTESTLSADNYLSGITLSAGSLSPAFSYKVYKYTATVPNSVTSLAVSANTSDPKAVVTSVSGNDNLAVGANTVTITVKAENGTTRDYTITVTRQGEGEDEDTSGEDEPDPNAMSSDKASFSYNSHTLVPVEEIPEDLIPEDFEISYIYFANKSYACLNFAKGDLTLVCLQEEGTESTQLFIYDHELDAVYPFVQIAAENGYVIALMPSENEVPTGYNELSLSIEGKGTVCVYKKVAENQGSANSVGFFDWFGPEVIYAAEVESPDYYLMYCMNQSGATGWYQYDATEGTYQHIILDEEGETVVASDQQSIDYANLQTEFKDFKLKAMFAAAIAAVVFVVMLICIICLAVSKRKGNRDYEEDDEFEDDEFEDDEIEENIDENDSIEDEVYDDSDAYIAEYEDIDLVDEPIVETVVYESEYEPEQKEPEEELLEEKIESGKANTEETEAVTTGNETSGLDEFEELVYDESDFKEVDTPAVKPEIKEEPAFVEAPKKAKFDTIDLTNIGEQLIASMEKVEKNEEPIPKRAGEVRLSPKEEEKHLLQHLSEGEPVGDDDDDFELLDL